MRQINSPLVLNQEVTVSINKVEHQKARFSGYAEKVAALKKTEKKEEKD